jgi:hypothetical protein
LTTTAGLSLCAELPQAVVEDGIVTVRAVQRR